MENNIIKDLIQEIRDKEEETRKSNEKTIRTLIAVDVLLDSIYGINKPHEN